MRVQRHPGSHLVSALLISKLLSSRVWVVPSPKNPEPGWGLRVRV